MSWDVWRHAHGRWWSVNTINGVDGTGSRHWRSSRLLVDRSEGWSRRWHLVSRARTGGARMRIEPRYELLWIVSVLRWELLMMLRHWPTHMWLVWVWHLSRNGHLRWSHVGSGHWAGLRNSRRAICSVTVTHVWGRLWVLELMIDLHTDWSTAWLSWSTSVWWVLSVWPILTLLVVLLIVALIWHLLMATSTAATSHSSSGWTHARW